jgi:HlyD family secretion protein
MNKSTNKRAASTVAIGLVAAVLAACGQPNSNSLSGYAEGEYVRVASPYAGNLAALNVKRGDQVVADAPLYTLEQENERASRAEFQARLKQAEARLENLRKGKRQDEIAAIRAQLLQAEAALQLSTAELKRTQDLIANKFVSPAKLDEANATVQRDRARVAELNAQIKVAQLAGRSDEIAAAAADVASAKEQLAQAEWKLSQKSLKSPKSALVVDTMYNAGEWVQAGMPVISLLPPENIKVRFFASEKQLSGIKIGQAVRVGCDGCAPLEAKISYVSPQAEYTSPLIYSKENRAALVFMIEARMAPADAVKLHPGQPVEVTL